MTNNFLLGLLQEDLRTKIGTRGVGQCSVEIGMSNPYISRLLSNQIIPKTNDLIRICNWMEEPVSKYFSIKSNL